MNLLLDVESLENAQFLLKGILGKELINSQTINGPALIDITYISGYAENGVNEVTIYEFIGE